MRGARQAFAAHRRLRKGAIPLGETKTMVFTGRRMLVNSLGLEPGKTYDVTPLERRFGKTGFWVEVTDGLDVCRCPYKSTDDFRASWASAAHSTR